MLYQSAEFPGFPHHKMFAAKKWLPVVKTAYRNRMLACYTRFMLETIYVCRSRGSTKRVFP